MRNDNLSTVDDNIASDLHLFAGLNLQYPRSILVAQYKRTNNIISNIAIESENTIALDFNLAKSCNSTWEYRLAAIDNNIIKQSLGSGKTLCPRTTQNQPAAVFTLRKSLCRRYIIF